MPGANPILPFLSSELFLVDDFGLQAWVQYRSYLEQVTAGFPPDRLGLYERKQASLPQIHTITGDIQPLSKSSPEGSIAVIKLSGVMQDEGGLCVRGADDVEADFRQAYSDGGVDAIVFDINSGGGMASAGWRLNSVIKERNKPVLSYNRYSGSAAVLASVPSDEIMGQPGSETGSIGAYIPIDKVLMEMLANDIEFIYAQQSTQKNGPLMAALRGDYEPLRKQVTKTAAAFIKEVEAFRPLNEAFKEEVLSGPMFTASEAKKRGLIDSVGTFTDAMKRARLLGKRHKQK
jgi:ClpP class serine protease